MRSLPLLAAAALAACGPAPSEPAATSSTAAAKNPSPKPLATGLTPVPDTVFAQLRGGVLFCGFYDRAEQELLIGTADVDDSARPTAVVMWGDQPVWLHGATTGGFAALERGIKLSGGGLIAKLTLGADVTTRHEGSVHRAMLEVIANGIPPERYDGEWRCGP